MSDTTDNTNNSGNRTGGTTLSLKRPAIEQSRVKQNFAHGRTKTVVVETKRKRFGEATTTPAADDKPKFQQPVAPRVETPQRPAPAAQPRPGVVLRTLSPEEREARERALAGSRVREAEERKRQVEDAAHRAIQDETDRKEREAAAKRKADDEARHREEEDGKKKAEEAAKRLAPKNITLRPVQEDDDKPRTKLGLRPFGGVIKRAVQIPVPTRTKVDADKRRGKLTVENAMSGDDEGERGRSIAAFRRRTERLKKQAQGFT